MSVIVKKKIKKKNQLKVTEMYNNQKQWQTIETKMKRGTYCNIIYMLEIC